MVNRVDPRGLFDERTCTVQAGDYLEGIGVDVGVQLSDGSFVSGYEQATNGQLAEVRQLMRAWNPHRPRHIYPGDKLSLPPNAKGIRCSLRDQPPVGSGFFKPLDDCGIPRYPIVDQPPVGTGIYDPPRQPIVDLPPIGTGIYNPPTPPPSSRTRGDWYCNGNGTSFSCQDWLHETYDTLISSGSPLLTEAADLMDFLGRRNSVRFNFNFPCGSGAITYAGYEVGLQGCWLDSPTISDERIAIMMHELWHVPQDLGRYSTWGEVEAYNFETAILREFGITYSGTHWRTQLETFGTAGSVSRTPSDMCQARRILMATFPTNTLYAAEPVIGTWLPADCDLRGW